MDKITIIHELKNNKNLLSLPQVLSEVLEEVGKEDYSADVLAKIILKDPSLTARLLKMANSPLYQIVSEIKTVHQAVQRLGVTTVKCMMLSASIFNPDMVAEKSGVDQIEFFIYVLSIAAACDKIARKVGHPAPEEVMIAGLMNDVGLMFLLHHYPEGYRKVLKLADGLKKHTDAEIEVFGIDHCEVGMYLGESWRLPKYVIESIADHHNYNIESDNQLTLIVKLAVHMSTDNFSGFQRNLEEKLVSIKYLASKLGMNTDDIDQISGSLLKDSLEMSKFLGVDIGDHENMLVKANQEIWHTYLTVEKLFHERQELSKKLLDEERSKGAIEAKNIAMATLSHYVNNAVMAIYGRSQLMRMLKEKDKTDKIIEQLPVTLDTIDKAVRKIVAVLDEIKELSPIDKVKFYNVSKAMNLDDKIEKRIEGMSEGSSWQIENKPMETVE